MVRHTYIIYSVITSLLLLLCNSTVSAFNVDKYAAESRLASGRWRKISVSESGVHFISKATLASWGISDMNRAVIAGYGARKVSDHLTADSYVDDLPEVPCLRTAEGIYFYGVGPEAVAFDDDGHITSSLNPFTTKGYYFISQGEPAVLVHAEGRAEVTASPQTTFTQLISYETDKVNYGSSGLLFLGDDFRFTPRRSYSFELVDKVPSTPVWISYSAASKVAGKSEFSLSVSGERIADATLSLAAVSGSNYGVYGSASATVAHDGAKLPLEITFSALGSVSNANLDAIFVNYTKQIALSGSIAYFNASSTSVALAGADESTIVWDVTDPLAVKQMNTALADGSAVWTNDYTGRRSYAAWSSGAKLPAPADEGYVANQNLHALSTPDMVIVTVAQFEQQANRIADIHRQHDGMTVEVVVQNDIFNEFSSGSPDFGAFRKFFKMLYDRGTADSNLQYALLFGRPTFDIRGVTPNASVWPDPVMPSWQSAESMIETVSFTSDDYLAFLEDNSGLRPGAERYSIAVGRIPAGNDADAKAYVDKLQQYITAPPAGDWHNRVIMTADDGDMGIHMTQADELVDAMTANPKGRDMVYDKVYIDAYPLVGGVCEGGRSELHRLIDAGAAWWTYTGHANKYYLTAQGIMTLNDINTVSNRRLPAFFGATCYFMQWDGFEQSGAEKLFFRPNAGIISAVTATRPVFISENSMLSRALGRQMFATDSDGQPLTIGRMLRNAKNALGADAGTSNTNKLRYALMGDPAMRVSTGSRNIVVSDIDGVKPDGDTDIVLSGKSRVSINGTVTNAAGDICSDFNGPISITLYDADRSVTTLGRNIDGTTGKSVVFDTHGERLYAGGDSVAAGHFSIDIAMPAELADNYRNALLSLNAIDGTTFATGAFSDFYVYGSDDDAPTDTVPPVIDAFYLNHPSFVSGDAVNDSPMLIARVYDNVGINLSSAGIGRTMSLKLDGVRSLDGVANYYTPASDGTAGGSIAYPLTSLQPGRHDLTLRVYDTSGNYAESTVEFTVDPSLVPEIYEVYTDANPASVEANFFINHNRPDQTLTVTMSVFNLMGALVWSKTVTDRSDMFTSAPITWNLHDLAGHRVGRGIYIYRAEITVDGKRRLSKGNRIAVTGK